jgi:Rrf2 family protein
MRVSAKAEYAIRACAELAQVTNELDVLRTDTLAESQALPVSFLSQILATLRRAGIVISVRGQSGGYRLAKPADTITLADIVRAVDGPLVTVRDLRPPDVSYTGPAATLPEVWVALRAAVRDVLERVTVQDLSVGALPRHIRELAERADARLNP